MSICSPTPDRAVCSDGESVIFVCRNCTDVPHSSDQLGSCHVLSITVAESSGAVTTPTEDPAIDRNDDNVKHVCGDRCYTHAREACDWHRDALQSLGTENLSEKPNARISMATHEKGSVCVDKCAVIRPTSSKLPILCATDGCEKEQRLRPIGVVARQRVRDPDAATARELAQRLLERRVWPMEESAELGTSREHLQLELNEDSHQDVIRERQEQQRHEWKRKQLSPRSDDPTERRGRCLVKMRVQQSAHAILYRRCDAAAVSTIVGPGFGKWYARRAKVEFIYSPFSCVHY